MIIKCMVWEIEDRKTGETITGNWVSAVAPKAKGVDVKAATEPAKKAGGGGGGYGGGGGQTQQRRVEMDDEIPF
jgi:hypothetical protein